MLFSAAFHPPIQCVPRDASLGIKRPGSESDRSPLFLIILLWWDWVNHTQNRKIIDRGNPDNPLESLCSTAVVADALWAGRRVTHCN
jgi:hypothetical protein